MNLNSKHARMISMVADLEEEKTIQLVHALVSAEEDPLKIIDSCQKGMKIVGERYQNGQYFISGLIMAAEILREVFEMVQPKIQSLPYRKMTGNIVLGTVAGDIHDLGKNIFKFLLDCNGINVIDLGVDVPAQDFIEHVNKYSPDIIGISALITGVFDNLKETIALIRTETKSKAPLIIGGAQIDEGVCRTVGADYWCTDACDGVNICMQLIKE